MVAFLVDASVGQAVWAWLRDRGFDALASWDRDPKLPDTTILQWAVADGRVVITADKDFGELVYGEKLPHAGVLLLRLSIPTTENKLRAMETLAASGLDSLRDQFTVYQDGMIRVRT